MRGLAQDLVGLKGLRRERLDPPAVWTSAGVAARLAVIWAAMQRPALVCGPLARRQPERLAELAELVDVGISAGDDLDLLCDVPLPVRCGRAVHVVVLRQDGSFALLDHPGVDVEAERVAVALGAAPLDCVREVVLAHQPHEHPGRPSGTCRPQLSAGELFWFVLLCRTWLEEGIDLARASAGLDKGHEYDAVRDHLEAGLLVSEAVAWHGSTVDEAREWVQLGFTADDRRAWLEEQRTLEEAAVAAAIAGSGRRLVRWARVVRGLEAERLGEWAAWGDPISVWSEIASLGLRAADVPRWSAELNPVEILAYVRACVPLEEALAWKEAGYGGFSATALLELGVSIDQARRMSGHPVRRVQALWKQLRSVDKVLAVLEAEEERTRGLLA